MCFGIARKAGLAIILSTLFLVACGGGEERQAKYLERANNYIEQENIEKAKVEIKNVLQINPNNAEAWYLLGVIAEDEQSFRAAYGNFTAAVGIDPQHVKSLNKLASYSILSNDLQNALEKIEQVLAVDQANADAITLQALVFLQQEKKEAAIEKALLALSFEPGHVQATGLLTAIYAEENPELALELIDKALSEQSKDEALTMLKIQVLASQDKRDEVISLYQELIAEYPDNLLYPLQLVRLYISDDRKEESVRKDMAEQLLRDRLNAMPEEEQLKLALAEFLVKYRGYEEGKSGLEAFIKESPENLKYRDALAKLFLSNEPFEKSAAQTRALYEEVIAIDSTSSASIEARIRLVEFAMLVEDLETARSILAEVLEIDPENSAALLTRARFKLMDKDLDGAIADLRVVLKGDPESTAALLLLGGIYTENNTPDLALDSYQRLLAVEPKNLAGLIGVARIFISKNELEGALRALEAAQEIDSNNPQVIQMLVTLYVNEQRWDDALSVAAKLVEHEQFMAVGSYLQGRIFLSKGDHKAAIQALEKSYAATPEGIETMGALVTAYLALEQSDKALDYVSAHVEKYPDQLYAQEILGNLYIRRGDIDKSKVVLEKVIQQAPDRISAYGPLVRLYASQGKNNDIEALYLNGIKAKPENFVLRLSLAEFYQFTDRYEQAVSIYEELLKSKPDAPVIKNNLASLLMDHFPTPGNLKRAAELAEDLAATENPAFLDTAGWAQYHQGNYPQAVSLLGAAVKAGGQGAVFHYHLGMAYFKSDLKQQAREQLELAVGDEKAVFVGKEDAERVLAQL